MIDERKELAAWCRAYANPNPRGETDDNLLRIADMLDPIFAEAVARERERCVEIATREGAKHTEKKPALATVAWNIAAAIRETEAAAPADPRDAEIARLKEALGRLYHGYVCLIEKGRNRILDLGGDCDSVAHAEEGDPFLIGARRTLTGGA